MKTIKQTFIIESFDGFTAIELLGCLEDTVSEKIRSVKEVK